MLSEAELRELARSARDLVPEDVSSRIPEATARLADTLGSVLQTCRLSNLPGTHRAAANSALCAILEAGSTSSVPEIWQICLNQPMWIAVYDMFMDRFETFQSKPMRQVMSTLVRLLTRLDAREKGLNRGSTSRDILTLVTLRCLDDVQDHHDFSSVKAAFFCLDQFISQKLITPSFAIGLLANQTDLTEIDNWSMRQDILLLSEHCFQWLRFHDIAPTAGKFLVSFYRAVDLGHGEGPPGHLPDDRLPLWAEALQAACDSDLGLLEPIERHLLPELLRMNSSRTASLVSILPFRRVLDGQVGKQDEGNLHLVLAICKAVQANESLADLLDDLQEIPYTTERTTAQVICIPLVQHPSVSIRRLSFQILSSSIQVRDGSMLEESLGVVRNILRIFHGETDIRTRNDFRIDMKKLLIRISQSIQRHLLLGKHSEHLTFLQGYMAFLCQELKLTASYQRHVTALKILEVLCTEIEEQILSRIIDWKKLSRLLQDLILDPYDDVRASSIAALTLVLQNKGKPESESNTLVLNSVIQRAGHRMSLSGRADLADGFGRLFELRDRITPVQIRMGDRSVFCGGLELLLNSLSEDVSDAEADLSAAVASSPIHGHLIAIRYVLLNAKNRAAATGCAFHDVRSAHWSLRRRFSELANRIWSVVSPILCVDSPEGHQTPEDDEDVTYDIGEKDTLSFCWRALKESSSVLHAFIITFQDKLACSEGQKVLAEIGDLTFTQLAELRHRGAFSAVAQTFAAFCQCLSEKTSMAGSSSSLEGYYDSILACIEEKASALTRRSAGLPAMITGLLSGREETPFFGKVIGDLQRIARVEGTSITMAGARLPQVHAMNSLKDIFTSTKFASASECYLEEVFILAVDAIENSTWTIRNCGLMLFKALLTRLVGGGARRSGSNGKHFSRSKYERYQTIPDLLLRLLSSADNLLGSHIDGKRNESNISAPSQEAFTDTVYSKHCQGTTRRLQNSGEVCLDPLAARGLSEDMGSQIHVIFPALQIVDQIGLPIQQEEPILELLFQHLGSRSWNIREKTAETLSSIIGEDTILAKLEMSLVQGNKIDRNTLHGCLLCLKAILSDRRGVREEDLNRMIDFFDVLTHDMIAAPVQSAYLDCWIMLLKHASLPSAGKASRDSLKARCDALMGKLWHRSTCTNEVFDQLRESLTQLSLLLRKDDGSKAIMKWLQHHTTLHSNKTALDVLKTERIFGSAISETINFCKASTDTWRNEQTSAALDLAASSIMSDVLSRMSVHGETAPAEDVEAVSSLSEFCAAPEAGRMGPVVADSMLELEGAILAWSAHNNVATVRHMEVRLRSWAFRLRCAGHDDRDFSSRFSAVRAIQNFSSVLRMTPNDDFRYLLPVLLELYDTLIDDDEEIRNFGASIVSSIKTAWGDGVSVHLLVPIKAAEWIFAVVGSRCQAEPLAFWTCLGRMTGCVVSDSKDEPVRFRPFHEAFEEVVLEDTVLFVEEKQNLYEDPVDEADRWLGVWKELGDHPCRAGWDEAALKWVMDAVFALADEIRARSDGPLGWMSKASVFELCERVIITAAGVLSSTISCGEKKSLKTAVMGMVAVARERNVHPLWLERCEDLLGRKHS